VADDEHSTEQENRAGDMMTDVSTKPHWRREGLASAWFHYVATHEWAAKMMSRLWNTDTDILWADIARLRDVPHGTAILDVPSGGGSAFRGIPAHGQVRYCAVDLAAAQLDRARIEAADRGVDSIEFLQADVVDLPYESESFDVCVSYGSLHCFSDPQAALTEIFRVLRPGSEVRGSTVVKGNLASRALIATCQRADTMGPAVGTLSQLQGWLEGSGYDDVQIRKSGLMAYFSGRRPA
jgi:SAM-dependent methyltransferase